MLPALEKIGDVRSAAIVKGRLTEIASSINKWRVTLYFNSRLCNIYSGEIMLKSEAFLRCRITEGVDANSDN